MDAPVQAQLLVELLNHYMYFYEKNNAEVCAARVHVCVLYHSWLCRVHVHTVYIGISLYGNAAIYHCVFLMFTWPLDITFSVEAIDREDQRDDNSFRQQWGGKHDQDTFC